LVYGSSKIGEFEEKIENSGVMVCNKLTIIWIIDQRKKRRVILRKLRGKGDWIQEEEDQGGFSPVTIP
jgi:hypothetical protein